MMSIHRARELVITGAVIVSLFGFDGFGLHVLASDQSPADRVPVDYPCGLDWPGLQHLKNVQTTHCRLLKRTGVMGSFAIEFVLSDGSSALIENVDQLESLIDWEVMGDHNKLLDVAQLILGVSELTRTVEYGPIHTKQVGEDPRVVASPYYGCTLLSELGIADVDSAAREYDLEVDMTVRIQRGDAGFLVQFPCVYWDLNRSVWLQEIRLSPSQIAVRSERTGLRLQDGSVVKDSGRYAPR